MNGKHQLPLDSYSKNEGFIDPVIFFTSTTVLCAAHNIGPVDPQALGLFLLAGANTAAIKGANALAAKTGMNATLLKVCALVVTLATTTLALPWILSAASAQTFAILSLETALETTLIHVALKTAGYAAFRIGLRIKNYFTVTLPTSVENVKKMSKDDLGAVESDLRNFPRKTAYVDLDVQEALNKRLTAEGYPELPLTTFAKVGDQWSKKDVERLHKKETGQLPINKRKELNQLFLKYNLPPQTRPYQKGELPEISAKEAGSSATVAWLHLLCRLDKNCPIDKQTAKLFYKHGLPPARNETAQLPLLSKPSQVDELQDYQIGWYKNLYEQYPSKRDGLSDEVKTALQGRFPKKSFLPSFSRSTIPLTGRVSKGFPWTKAVVGTVVVAALIGTVYYFGAPKSAANLNPPAAVPSHLLDHLAPNFIKSSPADPSMCAVTAIADVVKGAPTTSNLNHLAPDLLNKSPASAFTSSLLQQLETSIENTTDGCSVMGKTVTDNLKRAANKAANNTSSTCPLPPSTSRVVSTTPVLDKATSVNAGDSNNLVQKVGNQTLMRDFINPFITPITQSAEKVRNVIESTGKPPSLETTYSMRKVLAGLLLVGALPSAMIAECIRPRPRLERINAIFGIDNDDDEFYDFDESKTGHSSDEESWSEEDFSVGEGDDPVSNNDQSFAEVEGDDVTAQNTLRLDKEQFMDYCEKRDVKLDHTQAWEFAKKGLKLLQQFNEGDPIDPTTENLKMICWGLMAHANQKGEGFRDGTFVFPDPGYNFFKLFAGHPLCYGRASSHFRGDAQVGGHDVRDSRHANWSHFGIDIDRLPPNMRTVLFAKLNRGHGEELYMKFEDWGADPWITSTQKLTHFIGHTCGYLQSVKRQYDKTNSKKDTNKENLPPKHL